MTPHEISLIRESWTLLAADGLAPVVSGFYRSLFGQRPDLRLLFDVDMGGQACRFGEALNQAVRDLDRPEVLLPLVEALGRRHAGYRDSDQHYDAVGEALLDSFAERLGPAFTPDVRAAWTRAYQTLSTVMRRAAAIVPV
ncbi:MAG: globin domain-containing protein [Alphaproteobacteria bacterium]